MKIAESSCTSIVIPCEETTQVDGFKKELRDAGFEDPIVNAAANSSTDSSTEHSFTLRKHNDATGKLFWWIQTAIDDGKRKHELYSIMAEDEETKTKLKTLNNAYDFFNLYRKTKNLSTSSIPESMLKVLQHSFKLKKILNAFPFLILSNALRQPES